MFAPPAPPACPALAQARRADEGEFEIDLRLIYDLSTKYTACIPFADVDAPSWIRVGNGILTIRRAATLEIVALPAPNGPLNGACFRPDWSSASWTESIDTEETPV